MGSVVLLGCTGLVACSPTATAAKPPARTVTIANTSAKPVVTDTPKTQEQPREVADVPIELAVDVLPFDARANPFALPAAELDALSTATAGPRQADVRLVGLLGDGVQSTAVIELDGRRYVVSAGTEFTSPNGLDDLSVLDVRQSDIVVEQSGRRWIVPLPTP